MSVRRLPAITVTTLTWPFSEDDLATLKERLWNDIKYGRRLHVLDLDQAGTPNSTLFRALVSAAHIVRSVGGDVRLVTSQRGMRRVLGWTGLARTFAIHSTVKAAIIAFRELPISAAG